VSLTRASIIRGQRLTLAKLPLGALPRLDPHQEHGVDLFQALPACFREEEEYHGHGDQVARCKEVSIAKSDFRCDERGCEADEEVEG